MAPENDIAPNIKPPFSRIIAPEERGTSLSGRIEANAEERAALTEFYRVDDIASLALDYGLDPLPSGRYRLTGKLEARLTQLCVVTLEPLPETISEDVSIELWPEHLLEGAETALDPQELLESDPPEPIVNGRFDLGHLTAELFASAINPYPRKEDAEFDWTDPKAAADEGALKPFAALARLKGRT
jgi:hypothetical protein